MAPENSRYDVFISYSHEDARKYGEKAIQFIKDMIEADLHDSVCRPLVFLDSEALGYGDEWHAKIMEKLNECRIFVCLLSENYLKSSYCTRERLWWEKKEIQRGRLRRDTLPVYFISLDSDPFKDDRRQVRDLFGFQMTEKAIPWFDRGINEVKEFFLEERIKELKDVVKKKLSNTIAAEKSFNTVFPEPSKHFVGRILELKEIREICVNKQYPIIEGGGGVGKSELATVYAYGYAEEYPLGRFLIHMEGKKKWEEAIVSLVKDPETGKDVRKGLDISDEDMKENKSDSDLHRLIIEKLFARAEKGRMLLLLDNVDDASLFTDRKLQDFSLKRLIPDNIHMLATTRHQLDLSDEKIHARSYPIGNLDDDASFELFCEIGQNRFPFCRQPILDQDSDPEYKAVMEIIHLLEGHVWSMEIIAGQVADKYNDGVTFRKKLSTLKKKFIIKDNDKYSWRSVAGNPVDLVQGTLDILKNSENGDSIVQLAYFAAMLSPDGKKKDILRVCWDKLFADVEFEDAPDDVFRYAYNHLWHYNLIHGEDDDKMHRLTQAALKQIMKNDGIFEECVERLADVMAETPSISQENWINTVSTTPEIAAYFKKTRPDFLSVLLSPMAWVQLLSFDPSQPILLGMCPWDTLSGREWADLLVEHSQFADRCPWDKLDGSDWARLLRGRTQFADQCPWDRMNGSDWADLLREQTQFADQCPWDKLGGKNWADLLRNQPQFADQCPWDKLDGRNWAVLLYDQPQFADQCQWAKLTGHDWNSLLRDQPQFADQCQWDRLSGFDWEHLLERQPQFADHCKWKKLTSLDWRRLLTRRPQFADRCPWDKMDGTEWAVLLRKRPLFADKCRWEKLSGEDWSNLLIHQPQFADKCPWEKLNEKRRKFAGGHRRFACEVNNWTALLIHQPQFADKCPWDKLDGTGLAMLLPQFADRIRWDKLDGKALSDILQKQPQFADKCRWDKLTGNDWALLLIEQPQFADKCRWGGLTGEDWINLLREQPQFADKCSGDRLTGKDWVSLLEEYPHLSDKCPWDKLTGKDWADILAEQPQFAGKCQWDKLKGKDWIKLLWEQPRFTDLCHWDKLSGKDWAWFLKFRPRFADKCQWDKLDGDDFACLLALQPQFADQCHWDKLTAQDWAILLANHPQFSNQCPWDGLTTEDWAEVLMLCPQFADKCHLDNLMEGNALSGKGWAKLLIGLPHLADKCPWEKLDGKSWSRLLWHRPEFADRCPWDKLTGDEVTGRDWTWLLIKQPQFADKCPWEKLKSFHWKKLLERQPQFAQFRKE